MNEFSNQPTLRRKLIAVIMLCCSIALLLNNALIFSLKAVDFKEKKADRLFVLADVLANNSMASLQFSDPDSAREILQAAAVDKSIIHVLLFDKDCRPFAEYKKFKDSISASPTQNSPCNGENQRYYQNDHLYLSLPVSFKNKQIGALQLKSDLNDLSIMLQEQILIFSLLFALTLFIAFLITLELHQQFIKPIKKLLKAIRHITHHHDYSIQVNADTNDELALLAREFNMMIEKINQNDKLLNNQNLLLEKTVAERTVELHENLKQLAQAKENAEAANQAKSNFLSHMSHDLRTPLNSLLGYVQILQRNKDFPRKYLSEIQLIGESGEYLLSLINDLLDITKIETNKLELNPQAFRIRDFLNPIHDMFKKQSQKKNLLLNFEIGDSVPDAFFGDANRIKRILCNLLENAIKFTDQGYIQFIVAYRDEHLIICIEDSGCGIKEENLKAIFEPFNQFSKLGNNEGVGLGLYITRYLVELMRGSLSINSQLDQGATCLLKLPLPIRDCEKPDADQYQAITGYKGDQKTILLVDDNADNLLVLEKMLTPLGFVVSSVTSGKDCIEKIKNKRIDMVLLDVIMPEMDGIATCRAIQQLPIESQPKIIMVTANAFSEDREKCLNVGCDGFLAKPVKLNQLLEIFEEQLAIHWLRGSKQRNNTMDARNNEQFLNILIAEDDEISRLFLHQLLNEMKLDADFAEDGKQAQEMITQNAYDIIFLDNKMPFKSGMEVMEYIKAKETPCAQSYTVLITAFTNNEIQQAALQAGFNEVISKPFNIETFEQLIELAKEKSI